MTGPKGATECSIGAAQPRRRGTRGSPPIVFFAPDGATEILDSQEKSDSAPYFERCFSPTANRMAIRTPKTDQGIQS